MKKILKKENGITLVALVVTIIILLILAAISLNLVLGENGIISRTKEAREKTQVAQDEEEQDLKELEKQIGRFADIVKSTDTTPGELTGTGTESDPCLIESIEDLVKFQQEVNGGNTYEGKTIRLGLSLDFNEDESYMDPNGTSLGDINGDGTVEGIKKELTTSKGWVPIGTYTKYLYGNFKGNGKQIKNLHMDRISTDIYEMMGSQPIAFYGFFGKTKGEVSDLAVSGDVKIELKIQTAATIMEIGLIGSTAPGASMRNLTNNINFDIKRTETSGRDVMCYLGGITVDVNDVTSCINNGNLSVEATNPSLTTICDIAGIQCGAYGNVSNVVNNGNISASGITFGNFAGIAARSEGNYEIKNVQNNGSINVKGKQQKNYSIFVGGIMGQTTGTTINKAKNTGTIKCEKIEEGDSDSYADMTHVAGIVGEAYNSTIKNAINEGNIEMVSHSKRVIRLAGIAGRIISGRQGQKWTIENCINKGNITLTEDNGGAASYHYAHVAGIVAATSYYNVTCQPCNITNVYNEGNIKIDYARAGYARVGGVISANAANTKMSLGAKNLMTKGNIEAEDSMLSCRGFINATPNAFASYEGLFIDNNLSYTGTVATGTPTDAEATKIDMTSDNVVTQMNSNLAEGYATWVKKNGKVTLDF